MKSKNRLSTFRRQPGKQHLKIIKYILFLIFCTLGSLSVNAEDRIELEGGAIFGNSEAPKATYIVPWKPLIPVEIKGLEIETLLDEELELIDPELFKRQVELYKLANDK